jgi:hypothetical protein
LTYKQLNKVANANGHATVESLMGDIIAVIATDDDCLMWIPVALTKDDYKFAVERWGEDFRVLLDQLLGEALDMERLKKAGRADHRQCDSPVADCRGRV